MYKYLNMNPKGNDIEDCAIRAISVAEEISWDRAYDKLSVSARNKGLMINSVEAIEEYLDSRYERVPFYTDTVGEFIKTHSHGTFLITMQGHITVLKDGINYDTFDCKDRIMWNAWYVPYNRRKY